MLKRYIALSLLTAVSMFLLSGCYPTGMIRAESDKSGDEKTVYEIADEIENFALSLTLPDDVPPETIPKLKMAHQQWDKDKLCEIFLSDDPLIDQFDFDVENEPGKLYWYETANDVFYFSPGKITYDIDKNDLYGYDQLKNSFEDTRLDGQYTSAKECNFPLSDAIDTVNGIIDKIGIKHYTLSNVWAVTADIANDLLSDKKRMIKHEDGLELVPYLLWTSDNDAYYLKYSIAYENIPFMANSAKFADLFTPQGTSITAIVKKDKLMWFSCEEIYSMEYETIDSVSVKVSAEAALRDILESYSRRSMQSLHEIFDVKLVYVYFERVDDPTGLNYILMPMWEFDYGRDHGDPEGLFRRTICVDLQTGNRFDNG